MTLRARPHVAVVGAGAFGGWTALHLLRRGARVTLLDAWGAGQLALQLRRRDPHLPRRLRPGPPLRRLDGPLPPAVAGGRASAGERPLFRRTGALWCAGEDDAYVRDSLPFLAEAGLPIAELALEDARKRFPQIDFAGSPRRLLRGRGGYLLARRACQAVAEAVAAEGGEVRMAAARPGRLPSGGELAALRARRRLDAAGGPLPLRLRPLARRPLPGGDRRAAAAGHPAGDLLLRPAAGRPPVRRGALPDLDGARPASGSSTASPATSTAASRWRTTPAARRSIPPPSERLATPEGLARGARPAGPPLPGPGRPRRCVETRVCQYENSPDGHLLFGRHPARGQRLAPRRRLRPRLQARPRPGRARRRQSSSPDGTPDPLFQLDRPGHAAGEAIRTQFES